jgi:Na+/H+ antiporter NhaD/arsenite permease-like protein
MRLQTKTTLRIYLAGVLLLGTVGSPLPQFGLALALLILQIYNIIKPVKPSLNVALVTATLILTPLTLMSLTGKFLSVLFIIPAIYLLDQALQDNKLYQEAKLFKKTQRNITNIAKMLATVLLVVFVAALTFVNTTLLLSTSALLIYLAAILAYNINKIPKNRSRKTKRGIEP